MSTLSTISASNSAACAHSVFVSSNNSSGNSIGGGEWYGSTTGNTYDPYATSAGGAIHIGVSGTAVPYNPFYPVVPTQTIILDPRVEELEKKLAMMEDRLLQLMKLLPKALELIEPPETDGKRVVEL